MRRPTVLILASGLSVLAHALVLGLPGVGAFDHAEPPAPTVLRASLVMPVSQRVEPVVVAPVQAQPKPVAAPKAKQAAKPRPDAQPDTASGLPSVAIADQAGLEPTAHSGLEYPVEESPLPPADERSHGTAPLAGESAASAANQQVAAKELPGFTIAGWPEHGSIRFRVYLGQSAFQVGEARHEWAHDDKRYHMSVVLATTGAVGLFKTFHYVQKSEGALGPEGLRPEQFSVEQTNKAPAAAAFDWAAGQVMLRRGSRERVAAIRPGDQDLLSLWHQIGIVGATRASTELNVISGREATPSTLEVVGPESLVLPIGQLDTLRVRAEARNGSLSIDIWLARNYGMLPVRIRVVDDKGEVLDQRAVELRLAPPGTLPGQAHGAQGAGATEMIELRAIEESTANLTIGN